MLLSIILSSLEDPLHIAALLGYGPEQNKNKDLDVKMTVNLMHTLLQSFTNNTEEALESVSNFLALKSKSKWQNPWNSKVCHFQRLLSCLQNHMLAHYTLDCQNECSEYEDFLVNHLMSLFELAIHILNKAADILVRYPNSLELLYNVLQESVAGAMLFRVINSLLLMPIRYVKSLHKPLLEVLNGLDKFNQLLPVELLIENDKDNSRSETPTLAQLAEQSWIWIVDLQKSCSILIGRCFGGMLRGNQPEKEETQCRHWLVSELFSSGIENEDLPVECLSELSYVTDCINTMLVSFENLPEEVQELCKIAFGVPQQYDEACAVPVESPDDLFSKMSQNHDAETFEFDSEEKIMFDRITRTFFYAVLKISGFLDRSANPVAYKEVFKASATLRQKLFSIMCSMKFREDETLEDEKDGDDSKIISQEKNSYAFRGVNFEILCHKVLQRCLFLLIFVKGRKIDVSSVQLVDSDEDISDKPYVEFYKMRNDPALAELRRTCSLCLNFVVNDNEDKGCYNLADNGWNNDPVVVYKSLLKQKSRALSRYEGLDQLLFHLVSKDPTLTVLNCIQHQMLEGCFGLFNIEGQDAFTPYHHYLEGIESSPLEIQEKIRTVVQGIYEFLTTSLKKQVSQNSDNRQLLLVIVFSLSTRYQPNDLSLVINNDLVQNLFEMVNVGFVGAPPYTKTEMLSIASLKLIHILAMSCCINSKHLDSVSLEMIVNVLYEQFLKTLEIFDECCQSLDSGLFQWGNDRQMSDFLLFLRVVSSSSNIQRLLATKKWMYALLAILDTASLGLSYNSQIKVLKPKLLIIQLLQIILPNLKSVHIDDALRNHIVSKLFAQLGKEMWSKLQGIDSPATSKVECSDDVLTVKDFKESEGNVPVHDMGFDADKCFKCFIEGRF